MIDINKSPVLTSKNYGVNSQKVDENIFKIEHQKIANFDIVKNQNLEILDTKNLPNNLLSKEFDDVTKSQSNLSKEIVFDKDNGALELSFDNNQTLVGGINIVVENGINATLILKCFSSHAMFLSTAISVLLKENSSLNFVQIFDLENTSQNFASVNLECEANAQINHYLFDFGAKNVSQIVNTNLSGEFSKSNLKSIYFGKNENKIRLNYISNVKNKNCQTNMQVCGVLDDYAKKDFVGTISFENGSQKSVGAESEFCMLLSSEAKSSSTPILLSSEEDVFGEHSSATGTIDEEQLFYMQTRGLCKAEATKLLVKAKLNNITNSLFDENLKNYILERIDREFDEN